MLGSRGGAGGVAAAAARQRDGLRSQHPCLAERRDLLPGLGRVQFPPPDHHHLAGHRRHLARPLHQDRRGRHHPFGARLPEPPAAAHLPGAPAQGARRARRQERRATLLWRRGGDPDQPDQRQGKGTPRSLLRREGEQRQGGAWRVAVGAQAEVSRGPLRWGCPFGPSGECLYQS